MRGESTSSANRSEDLPEHFAPIIEDAIGVDITVIALWLGHEDTATTHQYVEADLAMKEAALRRVADPAPEPLRFTATDRLLDFLEAL